MATSPDNDDGDEEVPERGEGKGSGHDDDDDPADGFEDGGDSQQVDDAQQTLAEIEGVIENSEDTDASTTMGEVPPLRGFDQHQSENDIEIDTESIQERFDSFASSYIDIAENQLREGVTEIVPGSGSYDRLEGSMEVPSDTEVVEHEGSHGIHGTFGLDGGMYPDRDGAWTHDFEDADPAQRSALRDREGILFAEDEVPGLDEFRSDIESTTASLDADDFNSIESEGEASDILRNEIDEGALIHTPEALPTDESVGFDEQAHTYRVVEKEDYGPEDSDTVGRTEITLEDAAGDRYEIVANRGATTDTTTGDVNARNETNPFMATPDGYVEETPDGWGISAHKKDPDNHLGESDEQGEEAMRNLFKTTNRAWYRQAVVNRDHNKKAVRQMSIGQGEYSVENAGETLARTNESLTGESNHSRAAAKTLVNYHPDLLEATRQTREIPDEFKSMLNEELDNANADFRFEL